MLDMGSVWTNQIAYCLQQKQQTKLFTESNEMCTEDNTVTGTYKNGVKILKNIYR